VLDGDHVKFRDVTIAEDDGTTVALASGVKEGEKVVLNISSQISDGDKIRVNNTDSGPAGVQAAVK
jgi:hypothetical protein